MREPQSGSAHAVMDIGLVSGLEANTEDLSTVSITELLYFTEGFGRTIIFTVLFLLLITKPSRSSKNV